MSNTQTSTPALLSFSFNPACLIPCFDMDEAMAATSFLETYRKAKAGTDASRLSDLGQRMLKNLREPYLKPEYRELLDFLSKQTELMHNYKVAEALGVDHNKIGARMGKLSGRMKFALTEDEASNYAKPIDCLVKVQYDEHGSSSYLMTEEGRQVVKVLLAD